MENISCESGLFPEPIIRPLPGSFKEIIRRKSTTHKRISPALRVRALEIWKDRGRGKRGLAEDTKVSVAWAVGQGRFQRGIQRI